MKKTTKNLLLLGAASLAVSTASAATITWDASVDMYQGSTVETFVSTEGDLAVAYNASADVSGDADVTVNGVAFTQALTGNAVTGLGGESITLVGGSDHANAFGDGEFSSNGNIFHLIQGGTFNVSSISLAGLQIGQAYEIQVFNNDARGTRNENFITGYNDGNGGLVPVGFSSLNNSPTTTSAGDSIIGSFTADSATMSITIFGTNGGLGGTFSSGNSQSQINALQLRTVPEPSSYAMIAGFLGLSVVMLRRRK